MNDEEKLAYKRLITDYRDTHVDRHGFDAALSRNINSITEQFYGILVKYFDDYTEEQFHERMAQEYILLTKRHLFSIN